MTINRSDFALVSLPFILTSILLVVGYQILVHSTPEARLTPPASQAQTEILEESDFSIVTPQASLPSDLNLTIVSVPDNTTALDQIISYAISKQHAGLYLNLPVTINSDSTLSLSQVDQSSEENITRWTKKAISTAHQNNLHVVLALNLNASTTIQDFSTFTTNYRNFIPKWASLATEYGVTFFNPGITIGHPLYSNLTDQQFNQLLSLAQQTLRTKYSGRIGLGFCCSLESAARPGGYSFITVIPTPEHSLDAILPQIQQYQQTYNLTHIFHYDRDSRIASSINLNQ